MTPYILIGGSVFLGYQLVMDFLHHHDEGNRDRPLFFDHVIAMATIGTIGAGFYGGTLIGALVSTTMIAPMTWWIRTQGKANS
jgi:hypothetical protein